MKKLILLVMAAGLAVVAFNTSILDRPTGASNFAIIDGAKSPEAIPDRVAYSLMLRLISSARNESEKRHLKSYVANIGLQSDEDTNALFSIAEEYNRRMNSLDTKVSAIKERESLDQAARLPQTQQHLRQLQSQYDLITDETSRGRQPIRGMLFSS